MACAFRLTSFGPSTCGHDARSRLYIARPGLASRSGVPVSASRRNRAAGAQRAPCCWCQAWIGRWTAARPFAIAGLRAKEKAAEPEIEARAFSDEESLRLV